MQNRKTGSTTEMPDISADCDAIFRRLINGQARRADQIETALITFESSNPTLRMRTTSDYIALSKHQRAMVGIEAEAEDKDAPREYVVKLRILGEEPKS